MNLISITIALCAFIYALFKDCSQRWESEKETCIKTLNDCLEKTIKKENVKDRYIIETVYTLIYIKLIENNELSKDIIKFTADADNFFENNGKTREEDLKGSYKSLCEKIYNSKPYFLKYFVYIFHLDFLIKKFQDCKINVKKS